MKIVLKQPAETVTQPVFFLRGVPYIPHYYEPHRWVGPGSLAMRKVYTTLELMDAQAELKNHPLWPRLWVDQDVVAVLAGEFGKEPN